MKQYLELKGMEFFAYHGCYRDEELNGNYFVVDLTLHTDLSIASITDNIDDTLDYVYAYEVVKTQMAIRSVLVENVCQRILDGLFERFPQLDLAEIKISKLHPDIGGEMKSFSVVMQKSR